MTTTRTRRAELLANADPTALVALAERCLADAPAPVLVTGPEVGIVVMTVREPVESTRFHLGDVLVTRAEVEFRGQRGWAMRMGDDREAALAAAICDADAEAGGPRANEIDDLCRRTASEQAERDDAEWSELRTTIVRFDEMAE